MKVREMEIKSTPELCEFVWGYLSRDNQLKLLTLEALETGSFSFLEEYLLDARKKFFVSKRTTKTQFD